MVEIYRDAKRRGIQLFRERLSEKVHVTIPKGIVAGFEFTVVQRNLKEGHAEAMDLCLRVLKESNKSIFEGYCVSNSALIISHVTFWDCHVHIVSDNLSRNSCVYLALFTDPEGDSCFSIYQISWIKMKKVTFCKLKTSLGRDLIYNLQTFWWFCQLHFYNFVANSARK